MIINKVLVIILLAAVGVSVSAQKFVDRLA